MKTRERGCPSQGVIQHTGSHERSPKTSKFEDRTQEETLKQERRARRDAWNMQKCPQVQRKGQSYILLAFGCSVSTSAILNKTRGRRICCRFRSFDAHAEQGRSELS